MTGIDNPLKRENPYKWLQNACWNRLCTFASKDPIMFEPVLASFEKYEEQWKELVETEEVLNDSMYPPND